MAEQHESIRDPNGDLVDSQRIRHKQSIKAYQQLEFQHAIGQAPAKVTIHLWLTGLFPINRNEGNINYKYFSQYHKDLKLAHSFFKNQSNETYKNT